MNDVLYINLGDDSLGKTYKDLGETGMSRLGGILEPFLVERDNRCDMFIRMTDETSGSDVLLASRGNKAIIVNKRLTDALLKESIMFNVMSREEFNKLVNEQFNEQPE